MKLVVDPLVDSGLKIVDHPSTISRNLERQYIIRACPSSSLWCTVVTILEREQGRDKSRMTRAKAFGCDPVQMH